MQSSTTIYDRLGPNDDLELRQLKPSFTNTLDDVSTPSFSSTGRSEPLLKTIPSEYVYQGMTPAERGDPLQKYWLRTLTCIFLPILIAMYYAIIWVLWLQPYNSNSPVPHGRRGGRMVYYSWFVVSAIAINISKYGLAGIEAAMLMDPRWRAKNAMQLTMHCDKTWSGPSGWIGMASKYARGHRQPPSATWSLLAFISLLPLIALPLSGFTLELTSGYELGAHQALLTGQNETTFGDQAGSDVYTRTFNRWRFPSPSQLSGQSAFYVPDRGSPPQNNTWLRTFPNNWPDDDAMTVFLAPQSDRPLMGSTFGMQSSINCTTITSMEQFHLLDQRTTDGLQPRCPPITYANSGGNPEEDGLQEIDSPSGLCDFDFYTSMPMSDQNSIFIDYDTIGFTTGFMELAVNYSSEQDGNFSDLSPVLIEAVLWQVPVTLGIPCADVEHEISNNIGTTVKGMEKTYTPTNQSQLTGATLPADPAPVRMEAIGVQCNSSFISGNAVVDGLNGNYASFVRQEPVQPVSATLLPLATAVPMILRSEVTAAMNIQDMGSVEGLNELVNSTTPSAYLDSNNPLPELASNASWLINIYKSVNVYTRTPITCDESGKPIPLSDTSEWQQLQLITSDQFKQAILRVHKAYAIELSASTSGSPWYGKLLYTQSTAVVTSGSLSPIPFMVLLIVWGLCSCTLGLVFGTRPRWAEILDGFSMFRFGSEFPGFADGVCVKSYDQCERLLEIPGMIGDARPGGHPGHISLVKNAIALGSKEYQGLAVDTESVVRGNHKKKYW